MNDYDLTCGMLEAYRAHLLAEERAPGTVEKYLRDAAAFFRWLEGRPVTRETAAAWREALLASGHAPVTVNSMLAAVNGLFRFLGWEQRVKLLRLQRRIFRDAGRELSREEYERLVRTAR